MIELSKRFWELLEGVCEDVELVHVSKVTDFEEYGKSYDCYVLTPHSLNSVKVVESDKMPFPSEIIHSSERSALGEKFIRDFFKKRHSIKYESESRKDEFVQLVLEI